MIPSPAYQFKMVFVGDSAVGKSSLLIRFVDDKFQQDLLSTIGVDFHFRTINVNGQKVKLQVWDTAGQQAFRSIVSAYYHSADAIVIIYDITSYSSLDVCNFQQRVLNNIGQRRHRNKIKVKLLDQANSKRQVQSFSIEGILQGNSIITKHFQVSAKSGQNVEQSFKKIIQCLIDRQRKNNGHKIKEPAIRVNNPVNNSSGMQKCCGK